MRIVPGDLLSWANSTEIKHYIMSAVSIKQALSGEIPTGSKVTAKGWVRTRRDSKAGFSFISLHDGSCFDAIQVVAPAELINYSDEVQKLTAGCAVICTGELVESMGRGRLLRPGDWPCDDRLDSGPDRSRAHDALQWPVVLDPGDTADVAGLLHEFGRDACQLGGLS